MAREVGAPYVAEQMMEALPIGRAIAERLLKDPRMKGVWSYLRSQSRVSDETLEQLPPLQKLETWEITIEATRDAAPASNEDRGCAALLAFVAMEFSTERVIGTKAQAEELAREWLAAADLCDRVVRDTSPLKPNPELAKAIAQAGAYFAGQGELRLMSDNPYIVERHGGVHSMETRGRARALVKEMIRIFGRPNRGSVATIVMVALQTSEITDQDIKNWSTGIVDERRVDDTLPTGAVSH